MFLINKSSAFKARLIALELTVLTALYFVITWMIVPQVFTSNAALFTFVLMLVSMTFYYFYVSPTLLHQDSLETRGLGARKYLYVRTDNFLEAWRLLWIPMVVTGSLIVLAAWQKNTVFFIAPDWYALFLKFMFYLFSAFIQDILFFSYILTRLKDLVLIDDSHYKKIIVVLLFSALFSLIHLPNIPLMGLTFLFSFWLGYVFYSTPNLTVIVIVHALLGTLLHRVYELHMKIGMFYGVESHQGYFFRFLIPGIRELISNRW